MESDWIRAFAARLGPAPSHVLRGIGDDVACLSSTGPLNLLWTTDSQREGIHFRWEWMTPQEVGYRLLAVNLSDIFAKGGTPFAALVALGVPPHFPEESLFAFYDGLGEASRHFSCPVVGGDISRSAGGFDAVMSLLATSVSGRFPGRDQLEPGDTLYLLGHPGMARAGYMALNSGQSDKSDLQECVSVFKRPGPFPWLAGLISSETAIIATMDTSDGLGQAIFALADQSGVSVCLDPPDGWLEHLRIPSEILGTDPFRMAWEGGEDYDVLLGIRSSSDEAVTEKIEEKIREGRDRLIRLGTVVDQKSADGGAAVTIIGKDRGERTLERTGFDHT
uniref:Thiamine-monophosphate kinase n=1 Tax=Leptospirillum ferriphilum TaxID=178606 RepID=A0A7C3QXF1_9BACT